MNRIEQLRTERQHAHRQLVGMKSKVYDAFVAMETAAYSSGALPRKTKELIAVAISVVSDCESCIEWHVTQAAHAGATRGEIFEAIEVAIEMGGGPATVSARFALQVMDAVFAAENPAREQLDPEHP